MKQSCATCSIILMWFITSTFLRYDTVTVSISRFAYKRWPFFNVKFPTSNTMFPKIYVIFKRVLHPEIHKF